MVCSGSVSLASVSPALLISTAGGTPASAAPYLSCACMGIYIQRCTCPASPHMHTAGVLGDFGALAR